MTDNFLRSERLAEQGFFLKREGDFGIEYVMMVVYDQNLRLTVGLRKLRGPRFLLNKVTFPGGRLEPGETLKAAATRELREETGLEVPESAWVFVARNQGLAVFAACCSSAQNAKPLTDEPVYVMSALQQLALCDLKPEEYAPDFGPMLEHAIKTLSLS